MRPAAPRQRPPGTRLSARGAGPQRLESAAAEYAMLAQRRARLLRQIDLLERQRHSADTGFQALEQRMATLSRQMMAPTGEAVSPGLLSALPPDGHAAPEAASPAVPLPAVPLTAAAEPRPATRRRGMVLEY